MLLDLSYIAAAILKKNWDIIFLLLADDCPIRQTYQRRPSALHQPSNPLPSRQVPQPRPHRPRVMSDDFQSSTPIVRRQHRPIPPPLTHVQSSQSLAYFVYPAVPRYIPAHCSIYPAHRKPTLMPKVTQMPAGYRRA